MHMPSLNTVAPTDQPKGLYQPHEFKDNCGFGLIAHMQGKQSHHLVETAIHSLSCMTTVAGLQRMVRRVTAVVYSWRCQNSFSVKKLKSWV